MGLFKWEDGPMAVKEAGRAADQWAIVDTIEDDAFERDPENAFEFRVIGSKFY